jgi:hypothetical protein
MADDTVVVRVALDDGGMTTLRFWRGVYTRLAAEARAEGCPLRDYLARRVLASGLGDDVARGQAQQPAGVASLAP